MLPIPARNSIESSLPEEVWIDVGEGAYSGDPDASEWRITPEYRWKYQEFEDETAPFEHVTLVDSENAIPETNQPVDLFEETAEAPDGVDADLVTFKGRFVYDILSIRVTAEGQETRSGLTLTDTERAHGLCNHIYNWLLYSWKTRPLDFFDYEGNAVAPPTVTYADELAPPVRVDAIPGRGPTDVTNEVDANHAQYDAAVELHYVDGVVEHEYQPTEGESSVVIGE